jgi:hypothetical protein
MFVFIKDANAQSLYTVYEFPEIRIDSGEPSPETITGVKIGWVSCIPEQNYYKYDCAGLHDTVDLLRGIAIIAEARKQFSKGDSNVESNNNKT